MNRKGFASVVLIGAGALLLLAFGAYFAWSKKAEPIVNIDTSNWKTYTNKEYGFELKYPNDFIRSGESDLIGMEVLSSPDYKDFYTYRGGDIPTRVIEKGAELVINVRDLSDYSPYTLDELKKDSSRVYKIKEIKVGGERSLLNDGASAKFFHPNNGFLLLELSLSSAPEEVNYYSNIFNGILFTFNFTDNVGTKTNNIKKVYSESGVTGTLTMTTCGDPLDKSSCRDWIGANQSIVITDSNGLSQNFTTSSDGVFKIKLKPGQYTSVASSFSYPYTGITIKFTVSENGYTEVNLHNTVIGSVGGIPPTTSR